MQRPAGANATLLVLDVYAWASTLGSGRLATRTEEKNMNTRIRPKLVVSAVTLAALATGCAGAPDASKTLTRGRITSGEVVPAEELRVAEYLNYYPQHFTEPTSGQVGLDLRVGNPRVSANGGPAWLQVGLQARSDKQTAVAPLNLALVIDTSGSMQDPEKMPYVKAGLQRFLGSLAPNDQVALVGYSDGTNVRVPSQPVGDGRWIAEAVGGLEPGGSTNLHDGLMAGLAEVDRNFDTRRNNTVVLLTDGIANVGETDPGRIAADAQQYTDRGIHVTTIGLGHDINDALLSELARQGQGGYHYIDRADELDRVFRAGVSAMVQQAASDVTVTLVPAAGVRLVGVTGYDGQPPAGPVTVKLKDMGTGDSQVLLAQLDVVPQRAGPVPLADVTLDYQDRIGGAQGHATRTAMADLAPGGAGDPLYDTEVLRNVTIQQSAEGLKDIDRLYRSGRYQEAWDLANRLEHDLRRVAALTGEKQMTDDADLMRRYQDTLAGWVRQETGTDPGYEAGRGVDAGADPGRLVREPTPGAAVIEVR
jgi:Ca-activated chloride channel homolog